MKDNQRSVRRAHNQRVKQRAYRKYKDWSWYAESYSDQEIHLIACRMADNMKNCSCWMCGNPRKFCDGKARYTPQELKHERNLKEGIDEYFEEQYTRDPCE